MRGLSLMKRQSILQVCVFVTLACTLIGVVALQTRNNTHRSHDAFRTIDDAFAIHRSQGWSLTSAPTDGSRYRICGATQSDPKSGVSSVSGSFKTDNRSIDFKVEVAEGTVVAVEGLVPLDGGPLTYAVLTRDLPE